MTVNETEKQPSDPVRDALESCEAWIDRWTSHVGNCEGEDHRCTCGRAAVLNEARAALSRSQGEAGKVAADFDYLGADQRGLKRPKPAQEG